MPNAAAHKLGAAFTVGIAVAHHQNVTNGEIDKKAVVAALLAGNFGSLPDLLEPAIHPNHRGFFHSISCLAVVGYAVYRLYHWEPEDGTGKVLKGLGIVVGGAYITHLLMDATTKKSIPLI